MIISYDHKYLFIENPLTASWAIRGELCRYYNGTPILEKHSNYHEFRRLIGKDYRGYFVFIAIRNPLDVLVSRYVKFATDHHGTFSDPDSLRMHKIDYFDLEKFKFVRDTNASFSSFFLRFYKRPYSDLVDMSGQRYNYILHYEKIQEDFEDVLNRLGLKLIRPLPVANKTTGKRASWISYYSPELIDRAKKVCGPYMEKWGYQFPTEWGCYRSTYFDRAKYSFYSYVKNIYLSEFRYDNSSFSKRIRRIIAHFSK